MTAPNARDGKWGWKVGCLLGFVFVSMFLVQFQGQRQGQGTHTAALGGVIKHVELAKLPLAARRISALHTQPVGTTRWVPARDVHCVPGIALQRLCMHACDAPVIACRFGMRVHPADGHRS